MPLVSRGDSTTSVAPWLDSALVPKCSYSKVTPSAKRFDLTSSDNGPPLDSIKLEGMTFYAYHGVNQEERELGQRFVVDLTVETDLSAPGRSDSLSDTINYSDVYRTVKAVVEGQTYNLLEAVAEAVAQRILASFPAVAVRARVTKPSPPIRGAVLAAVSVEVYRERQPPERSKP